mmetsp:Transcript_33545/g.68970  ORF Transcript_33545/g.68970 Transcript_33545/m.68970 type:complete len:317 (-) Transcript_33545:124-1074(-)
MFSLFLEFRTRSLISSSHHLIPKNNWFNQCYHFHTNDRAQVLAKHNNMKQTIPFLLTLFGNTFCTAFCGIRCQSSSLVWRNTSSMIPTHMKTIQNWFKSECDLVEKSSIRNSNPLHAAFLSSVPEVLGTMSAFYKTKPLTSAFVTCAIKASAADVVAQTAETSLSSEGMDPEQVGISKRRNLAFFMYGGIYQGLAQEVIFNQIFPALFGEGSAISVLNKVLFNSMVVGPFLTLPTAYIVKIFIFKHSFLEAMSTYKNDVINHGLLKKFWSIWVPVQFLTFGVVPKHFRILFISVVSFFWLVIFSSISASHENKSQN